MATPDRYPWARRQDTMMDDVMPISAGELVMVEGMARLADEDDETFLLRAEGAIAWEQEFIRSHASSLVARAVSAVDKPETLRRGEETGHLVDKLRSTGLPQYVEVRAALLARSKCRQMLALATGTDPVAQEAYRLLSELALAAFVGPLAVVPPDEVS